MTSTPDPHTPTADERRAAVVGLMAQAPGLIRYAARYTASIDDAEDAYQEAMERALREAPVVERADLVPWVHVVIRNVAHDIARRRRLERPGDEDDVTVSLAGRAATALGPDAVAEWRERYRGIRAGLGALTTSQRVCLMLKSAGASYGDIADMTGYSQRKIQRSILEGRAALHSWEERIAVGDACGKALPALQRVADAEATRREERRVQRHVKACQGCRAILERRRETGKALSAMVPPALLTMDVLPTRPPDPSQALAWWERMAGGATVRAGTVWQHTLELPAVLGTKVGATTAAAVVAGAAGGPLVADALREDGTPAPRPTAAVRVVAPPTAAPPVALGAPVAGPPVPTAKPAPERRTRSAATPKPAAAAPAASRAPTTERAARAAPTPPPPLAPRTAARTQPRPTTPRPQSLEFGP